MAYSQYFGKSSQLLPVTSVNNITPPTFAGISTLVQNNDGSITASWSAASGSGATPFEYTVYVQAATATGLFSSVNVAANTTNLSQRIFMNSLGNILQVGQTYYVGVRAETAVGVYDSNLITLSITVTNINYANLAAAVWDQLKSAHTGAGTFGQALQANVDVNTSTLAPASTALSTVQWTNGRASNLDNLDTTVSSRATQSSVNAIPTNPLLTTDSRLNNLDATISSRATASAVAGLISTVGIPAGASVSADIASVKSDTSGLRTDYTTARAAKLDDLDATISSRASQSSVNAIPTTPQLAATALTQYNALIAALGNVQNNTNFSGIVPQIMDQQFGSSTETYTFYVQIFNSAGAPADADGNIVSMEVSDNQGNVLQPSLNMTPGTTGMYYATFTVTAAMLDADVVVNFAYQVSGVQFYQIRTSKIEASSTDSANIAAIKAKTDNLPSDPASNTVVNTRASQSSVNAIPTNPLLTTDSRLNNLDAAISSRASAVAVAAIPTNPLLTTDSRLNNIDTTISSRASQTSVNAISTTIGTPAGASVSADIASVKSDTSGLRTDYTTARAAKLDNIDTSVSSRASQTTLDSYFGNMSTLVTNLQATSVNIASTEVDLATDVTNLGTEITSLNASITNVTNAATNVNNAATTVENAAALVVATVL